ncbi:hypothetical protein C4544_03790 [candidate division WS5 bacterium]|uniref:SGNH/GDSL hydrolase family protein n=1 Tax=candidate division WS5 bacterium TaxID=2093353 RepID=A0A419DD50_9BACT|nr:MAG: hypothetical protein C4544_03790 [candidate division WS5 bacterium]
MIANDNNKNKPGSCFYRNPKKTILIFVVLSILLMVFSAEKYLDLINRDYSKIYPEDIRTQRCIRLREHIPLFNGAVRPDDLYMKGTDSLVQKDYLFRTDGDGFIMPSRKHEQPDINIFFLGGSTTECEDIEEKNRFPYLVGAILENKSGIKINSFNSGVSGNNSLHSINILYNKIVPMNPSIVIMMHNINDLNILLLTKSYWNVTRTKSPIQVIVENKTSLYYLLKTMKNYFVPNLYQKVMQFSSSRSIKDDEFSDFRRKKVDVDQDKIINEFKKNLQTFINICKSRDITPVLMTMANRLQDDRTKVIDEYFARMERDYEINRNEYKKLFDIFNQTIIELGRINSIIVIDLAKEIPPTKEFMYDVVHFNDSGSVLAAEYISKKLFPLLKIADSK